MILHVCIELQYYVLCNKSTAVFYLANRYFTCQTSMSIPMQRKPAQSYQW